MTVPILFLIAMIFWGTMVWLGPRTPTNLLWLFFCFAICLPLLLIAQFFLSAIGFMARRKLDIEIEI
jgi:ABC-type polysaccharide/polyol phosphate export permease